MSAKMINVTKSVNELGTKFYELLSQKSMVDVTLSAEGRFLQAHKVILAASSVWFEDLFAMIPDKHPVIVLKDVKYDQLQQIVQYLYRGTVDISEFDISSFVTTLLSLRVTITLPETQESQHNEPLSQPQQRREIETPEPVRHEHTSDAEDLPMDIVIKEEPQEQAAIHEESQTLPSPENHQKLKEEPQSNLVIQEPLILPENIKEEPEPEGEESHDMEIHTESDSEIRIAPEHVQMPSLTTVRITKSETQVPQLRTIRRVMINTRQPGLQHFASSTKPNMAELSQRLSRGILIRRVKVKSNKPGEGQSQSKGPIRVLQGLRIQKMPGQQARLVKVPVKRDIPFEPMKPIEPEPEEIVMGVEIPTRQNPTEYEFKCEWCSKVFNANKRRNAHQKFCFKNPHRPSSKCPFCPMELCNPQYIATHVRKVHFEDAKKYKLDNSDR